MAALSEQVKARVRPVVVRGARRVAQIVGVDHEMRRLHDRVNELEAQLQEALRLHQRVAELTDVVTEILVPAADRDDERMKKALAGYTKVSY